MSWLGRRLLWLHRRILQVWQLLWSQHRAPGRVFFALLLGFVVGCTPLFGVQIFICMALARLLRLNLPIMYAAANISIPPMVPVLGLTSVQLGTWLTTGHALALSRADFATGQLHQTVQRLFWAWLRGGVLLGTLLGLLIGGAVYVLLTLRNRRARAPDSFLNQVPSTMHTQAHDPVPSSTALATFDAAATPAQLARALAAATQRYAKTPRKFRYYALAKYRMDPCYRALAARIPAGSSVVDLGCGLGMLAVLLGELGQGRQALGIDWDEAKVAAGQVAAAGLPAVTLQRADAREFVVPPCEVVTIVDVLHYYEPAVQTAILARAAAALRPGGLLLVRETDPARAGGARLTRSIERLMVRLGWNRGPTVYYRPIEALHADLRALGLSSSQVEVAGATHPGNVLLCAQKPPTAPAA